MTDWDLVHDRDCAVPTDRALDDLVAELAVAVRDPTPSTAPTRGGSAHLSNSMRTLRALYVLVDTGIGVDQDAAPLPLRHRDALKARLAEVLAPVFQHS